MIHEYIDERWDCDGVDDDGISRGGKLIWFNFFRVKNVVVAGNFLGGNEFY